MVCTTDLCFSYATATPLGQVSRHFYIFCFYSQAQKAKQSEKPKPKDYCGWLGSFRTPLAGFLNIAKNNQKKKKYLTKSFPG